MPASYTFTCADATRRVDDYIDLDLSDHDLLLVRAHLALCATCSRRFAYEARFWREVRATLDRVPVPVGVFERLAVRLNEARATSLVE